MRNFGHRWLGKRELLVAKRMSFACSGKARDLLEFQQVERELGDVQISRIDEETLEIAATVLFSP